MLRRAVIALGLVMLLGAAVLYALGAGLWVVVYLGFEGVAIIAAVLFERWKDHPAVDRTRGRWQRTGERFVDPISGQVQEVWYNPDTGQRDYVDTGAPPPPPPGP